MSNYQFAWGKDGAFMAEQVPVRELAGTYGSPLHVISQTQLLSNLKCLQESFARGWQGEVRVLPAIKSNTSFALCRALARHTDGCDLFSEGELKAALEAGFDPAKLSLNGNNKLGADLSFLEFAIERGVRLTLDDRAEFAPIEAIARKLGKKALIRLRVRPSFPAMNAPTEFFLEAPLNSEIATQIYKAGIPTEDLIPLGRQAIASEHVDFSGLHLHLGRHRAELEFWEEVMSGYARLIAELQREWRCWQPRELDIGGGYAQHLDPMRQFAQHRKQAREMKVLSLLMKAAGLAGESVRYALLAKLMEASHKPLLSKPGPDLEHDESPSLQQYGQCGAALRRALAREGIDNRGICLELEPGRGLFGSAAIHLCRVSFIKRQSKPFRWAWAVTDTTECWLSGGGHEANHPYVVDGKPIDRYRPAQRMIADIAGKSCGPDRIIGDACLPGDLEAGDLLVLVGTGAYQEMRSSNFNSMGRPATVLVDGDRHALIRRRESIDDVFDRELIAPWLQ